MPYLPPDLTLEALRSLISGRFPELAGARFSLLAEGWDSVAIDVDDRLILKFPRDAQAEAALIREARVLQVIRPAVAMPVPLLELFHEPRLFSRHGKIAGDHLLASQYAQLPSTDRQRLGEQMGQFYAELHAIEAAPLAAAGAMPLEPWLEPDETLRRAWPVLPEALRPLAQETIARWSALPADPHGTVYGFFDGHGWNMAFDHAAGRLNGLYDFGDSGFGPLHQEFIYSNFISPDLTARIIAAYEAASGRHIDRERVDILTGAHRMWELAMEAGKPDAEIMLASVAAWAAR